MTVLSRKLVDAAQAQTSLHSVSRYGVGSIFPRRSHCYGNYPTISKFMGASPVFHTNPVTNYRLTCFVVWSPMYGPFGAQYVDFGQRNGVVKGLEPHYKFVREQLKNVVRFVRRELIR